MTPFPNSKASMIFLLHLETAADNVSVALSANGSVVDSIDQEGKHLHAQTITLLITGILERNDLVFQELAAVSVSAGPGSYTGLRIGVATAKGLCYALDKPLIAVSTLLAMYSSFKDLDDKVDTPVGLVYIPMLDARRMEVYTAAYSEQGKLLRPVEAVILTPQSFEAELAAAPVVFFGSGSAKAKNLYEDRPNARFEPSFRTSARGSVGNSWERYQKGAFENVSLFEPFYLKEFMFATPRTAP